MKSGQNWGGEFIDYGDRAAACDYDDFVISSGGNSL
jgi:hypothetical protein